MAVVYTAGTRVREWSVAPSNLYDVIPYLANVEITADKQTFNTLNEAEDYYNTLRQSALPGKYDMIIVQERRLIIPS